MQISDTNQSRLIRNAGLSTLVDNSYLQDDTNENFQYIKEKFFRNETQEYSYANWQGIDKAHVLNVGTGFFSSIPTIISNYVGNPDGEIKCDIVKFTKDYYTYGFACVGFTRKIIPIDGTLKNITMTDYLPAEGYFMEDGVNKIARFYSKGTKTLPEYYALIQSFYAGFTENKLYKMLSLLSLDNLEEVPLETIQETRNLQPRQNTGRDIPAIYIIKEDENVIYPSPSELEKIKNMVYSLERRKVMFDCEFLKNVESFILTKGINRPQKVIDKYQNGSRIDISDLGRIIDGEEKSGIEFIKNTNDLIQVALEQQKEDIKALSAVTTVPIDFLGIDVGTGSIGVGSRSLVHGAFIKTIENIRQLWNRYLPTIYDFLGKENAQDTSYIRPDIFAKSDTELVEELKVARESKLISQKRGIMLYLGLEEQEAKEEIEEINKESLQANPVNENTSNGYIQATESVGESDNDN